MIYASFSLNGTWRMDYREEVYSSEKQPEFKGALIENAVPGYWEDMTDRFSKAEFYRSLRVNPAYGLWQYPISQYCPDMSLPNVLGNFFYSRTFLCENIDMPAALYFGGVHNAVSVWLNGEFLGRHEGYSTSFEMHIPNGLLKDGENSIVLSVSNHRLDGFDDQPVVGLSSRADSECSGGIWGDVELRVYTSPLRDLAVLVSEDLKTVDVKIEATSELDLKWTVLDGEKAVKSGEAKGSFFFDTDGLAYWSPECPKRYILRVESGEATLEREFGVRRLTVDGVHLRLNGEPYYLRGICEHCYYPETVNPCRDITFYRNVIKKLKELGFNYIRFHTYVPTEEYMQAADELGILMHIESPSNTTFEEWMDIVRVGRRHTSTVIYCCGNELQMHDKFIDHLHRCADEVHEKTDSLFSPMSALRGLEYAFGNEPDKMDEVVQEPMPHNPRRFAITNEFCDLYNSYTNAHHSYFSMNCDVEKVDSWSAVYNKPRLSHEICIDGTYTDLSLKDRYKGTRIGKYSDMLESLERHLEAKGLLKKAPLYFRNSCEWQRRNRKYCFEAVRRGEHIAGYDFLGPIDTHWHTFGYDVGMMNEFYELKPGESVRNVRMYNSDTVLLTDLGRKANFASGEQLSCSILTSCYGVRELKDAWLNIRLTLDGRVIERRRINVDGVKGGAVTKLYDFNATLPEVHKPCEMKLYVELDAENMFAENEWELYLYPRIGEIDTKDLTVVNGISESDLADAMEQGKKVVLLGASPFPSNSMSFKIALAGRPEGNLATVIADHPIFSDLPHGGFCGWQFESLMEGGRAVFLDSDKVPFDPIVDVAHSHKNAMKQAALFEFNMLNGKFLVCSFNFKDSDPAACWLKKRIIDYANSDRFEPVHTIDREGLHSLISRNVVSSGGNTNFAFNPNDKAAKNRK
ncbi:MAG: beta galactosidase jelly roll domain-containing protein [Clostridia bacterium]|nr:beta galactosidase jelly roll domain-containing protein [Clostridia bacterium]